MENKSVIEDKLKQDTKNGNEIHPEQSGKDLEETFKQLDEKINRLEDENISLEESFRLYQEGMQLLKLCNEQIDTVEKKVLMINDEGVLDEF